MTATLETTREVWVLQRMLAHYRMPVFDALAKRLAARGESLRLLVDLDRIDGDRDAVDRPYLEAMPSRTKSALGREVHTWPEVIQRIRARRPAAVIAEGSPKMLTNWRLPSACHAVGASCIVWTKGHRELGEPESAVTDFVRSRFARRFDAVLCYGKASRDALLRLNVDPANIFIAQNTIDTSRIFVEGERFAAEAIRLREKCGLLGRRIMLCCGTMYAKKRQTDAIDAWPALRERFPDLSLVYVGGGPELERVRERAAAVDPERILVVGRVPDGADYSWIAASDVNIFCGGLGLAINQCLAFGKPTVVADEPGADGEIVVHGETGWRYRKSDVAALADAVTRVLSSPDEAARIGLAGRRLIQSDVTIERMVDSFLRAVDHCRSKERVSA